MTTAAQCCICERGPFLLQNLYAHMRNVHHCSEDEVKNAQLAIKKAIYEEEVKCDICGKIYFSSGGLRRHKRTAHQGDSSTSSTSADHDEEVSYSVECPGCRNAFYSNMELAMHCEREHSGGDTDFSITRTTFDSWTSFEAWMTKKERETRSKLVKRHSRKSSKGTIFMYLCQHARGKTGNTSEVKERKRLRKRKRVSKHCPCFARVQQRRDGVIEVISCFGHYGHDVNSASLPLSSDDKMVVESMLMAGDSPQRIVRKLRESNWIADEIPEKQPRICYITVRDVTNIATRRGLNVRSGSNDSISDNGSLQDDGSSVHDDDIDQNSLNEVYEECEEIAEIACNLERTKRIDLLKQLNIRLRSVVEQFRRDFADSVSF